ncbi:hypothetical protein [Endozoicomonas sp.]|uniref:hypothetical protein n=1 Tax=Endozoicomonas sp. TaxID=1892382 RepID=UPI003AF4AF19
MNTFTIEGWKKSQPSSSPIPIEMLHFRINDHYHLILEQAEETLLENGQDDMMIDIDISTMELETSKDCGGLADCQLRVYLSRDYQRGHFHLVGHSAIDGSLIYSNAVMVDQLG